MIDAADPRPGTPDPRIVDFVRNAGLVEPGQAAAFRPLTGGVSSDIWLIETDGAAFCVKQALPKLKVAADWHAPVERSRYEAAWLAAVGGFLPESVPRLYASDPDAGLFAMEYLAPENHPLWKGELLDGRVDADFAGLVGERLARIHAAFARDPGAPEKFATDAIFHAIRLEPYLLATARAHADRAAVLEKLAQRTAATRRTVVHGDVSPKNILHGPRGPVFLDAECAWYGDPAFDLAFCLNHLLLKSVVRPEAREALLNAFARLAENYLRGVDWEAAADLEQRAANLLPGLFLARIDGKSPVEYITRELDKNRVRRCARMLLAAPVEKLAQVAESWRDLQDTEAPDAER